MTNLILITNNDGDLLFVVPVENLEERAALEAICAENDLSMEDGPPAISLADFREALAE